MSILSISSDEEILFNAGEDPVVCWASSKLNKRNRVEIRKSDYLKLEERGILNLKKLIHKKLLCLVYLVLGSISIPQKQN